MRTHKVLIVEDDEMMLSLLRTLLQLEGFEVVGIQNGASLEQTVELVRQEKPALVLLDVRMRNFNGFDLLQCIREDQALESTRVLMSSGMDVSDESRRLGADGFVLKPYMPGELILKIQEILRPS